MDISVPDGLGNVTASLAVNTSNGEDQPVTGAAVLWALFALALTAMSQQSYTARKACLSHDIFDNAFTPHRVSPVFCLYDIIGETWQITLYISRRLNGEYASNSRRHTRPEEQESQSATSREEPNAAVLCMKLVLFALGALPQAIKLFAFEGIPLAQTCAAVYITASVIHSIYYLLIDENQEEEHLCDHEIIGELTVKGLEKYTGDDEAIRSRQKLLRRRKTFREHLFYATCAFYGCIWPLLVLATPLFTEPRPEMIQAMQHWLMSNLPILMTVLFAIIVLGFPLVVNTKFMHRIYPFTRTYFIIAYTLYNSMVLSQAKDEIPQMTVNSIFSTSFSKTALLFFSSFALCVGPPTLFSLLIATILSALASRTIRIGRTATETVNPDQELPDLASTTTSQQTGVTTEDSEDSGAQAPVVDVEMASGEVHEIPWKWLLIWRVLKYIFYLILMLWTGFTAIVAPERVTRTIMSVIARVSTYTQWTAFLIFNVLTATVYYTLAFDNSNTYNPGWTGVFGR